MRHIRDAGDERVNSSFVQFLRAKDQGEKNIFILSCIIILDDELLSQWAGENVSGVRGEIIVVEKYSAVFPATLFLPRR